MACALVLLLTIHDIQGNIIVKNGIDYLIAAYT